MKRVLLALMVVAVFAGNVSAAIVVITPTTEVKWTGDATGMGGNNGIYAELKDNHNIVLSNADIQYKADAPSEEDGPFQDFYSTAFNASNDPHTAVISWDGPAWLAGAQYLLVKNGNSTPAWYLFDLQDLRDVLVDDTVVANYQWDGKDTLRIENFWPNTEGTEGRISHVAIFGGTHAIPEPTSLAIWAVIAAGGAAVAARKRRPRWSKADRDAILGVIQKG